MFRVPVFVTVLMLVFSLSILSAESAEASPAQTSTEQCAAHATAERLHVWVCVGGVLSYSNGPSEASKTLRVAGSPASDFSVAQMAPEPANFDSYCEYARTCTGYRNAYISWTKGNAAYGNQDGGIGSFDVILRTNLNGRQMQWRTEFWHDSGPSLRFDNVFINCREEQLGPNPNCGVHAADNGDGDFSIGTGVYKSPVIYGNRLRRSDDYYATISGYFYPAGYPRYTMSALRGGQVECYGTGNCTFRDA